MHVVAPIPVLKPQNDLNEANQTLQAYLAEKDDRQAGDLFDKLISAKSRRAR